MELIKKRRKEKEKKVAYFHIIKQKFATYDLHKHVNTQAQDYKEIFVCMFL